MSPLHELFALTAIRELQCAPCLLGSLAEWCSHKHKLRVCGYAQFVFEATIRSEPSLSDVERFLPFLDSVPVVLGQYTA